MIEKACCEVLTPAHGGIPRPGTAALDPARGGRAGLRGGASMHTRTKHLLAHREAVGCCHTSKTVMLNKKEFSCVRN